MKRFLLCLLLGALCLGLFAACGEKSTTMTQDEAILIALADAKCEAKDVSGLHVHTGTDGNTPVYNIHFSSPAGDFTYTISGLTGEVLNKTDEILH